MFVRSADPAFRRFTDDRCVSRAVATSDAQGAYRCEDIGAGRSLQARARGCAPSLSHGLAGSAGNEQQIDLTLTAAARHIAGMVRDAAGQPLADALVVFVPRAVVALQRIDATKPWRRSPFLRTDAAGRFTTDEVAQDEHVVAACAASRPDDAFAVAVLDAGSADAFVDLRLRPGAVVEGRALDGGQPMPLTTTVIAWLEKPADDIGYLLNLFGSEQTFCGDDGRYRLSGLAPGEYQLQAMRGPKFAERRLTIAAGDHVEWNPDRASGAALRLRFTPARFDLLGPFCYWNVTVLRRADQGGYEYVNVGITGLDGRVTITGLTPGRYDIVVWSQLERTGGSSAWIAHRADLQTGADEITVEIPDNDLPSARFRGRVLDGAGQPVAGARVVAVRFSDVLSTSAQALSDAQGRFAIGPLTRGTYGLRIEHGPQPTFLCDRELFAGREEDLGDVRVK